MQLSRLFPVLFLLVILGGCYGRLQRPIPSSYYGGQPAQRSDTLLVMLPGINDQREDFAREGFIAELRRRAIRADVVSVASHAGYYFSGELVERLHQDIILPARREGYRSIWLIGISLGGMGCMLYADEHPEQLSGVVLIAPFLGRDTELQDLRKQGLQRWLASPTPWLAIDRRSREAWQWVAHRSDNAEPAFYLAYGRQDRYAAGQQLLAQLGTPTYLIDLDGAHDWPTWQLLWSDLLQGPLGAALAGRKVPPAVASVH
ncbi:alpha/beta fold hydrolase [Crenobacter sp. SG2303]|uniref:Alpha/beta fold hydrolase n=1 Tax=Crenobacter oryzisoli TaxID=3056844 RepID=A0ABT7XLD1_9NEIS|nr:MULTISPECIES: alpha/beta hydrolase [unclassified Crenobacter]MDN0074394.1 alpha/beta fold hydrolase [Crenobacter sp. SG2303]MDN0081348.1 alpha/beta fold hydrolase [Crenobacter sp. SG2305]